MSFLRKCKSPHHCDRCRDCECCVYKASRTFLDTRYSDDDSPHTFQGAHFEVKTAPREWTWFRARIGRTKADALDRSSDVAFRVPLQVTAIAPSVPQNIPAANDHRLSRQTHRKPGAEVGAGAASFRSWSRYHLVEAPTSKARRITTIKRISSWVSLIRAVRSAFRSGISLEFRR